MLAKTDIELLINNLDSLYNTCNDSNLQIYYSKFALLELCGWLELAMDEIIISYSTNNLTEQDNIDYMKQSIVGKTYGFNYDSHFRPMLLSLVGVKYLELLEQNMDMNGDLTVLKSELSTLWGIRKKAAHTSISGITLSFHSPSIIKNSLNKIYPILLNIENLVK